MSAVYDVHLICDKCGKESPHGVAAMKLRAKLRPTGWRRSGAYDYCGDCLNSARSRPVYQPRYNRRKTAA